MTQQRRITRACAPAAACGLLAWALTMFLAVAIAGAGHGWMAPLLVSLPLAVLYPLVLVGALSRKADPGGRDAAVLLAALLLDLFMLGYTRVAEPGYFVRAWRLDAGLVGLWITLWLGWQVAALAPGLRRRGAAVP